MYYIEISSWIAEQKQEVKYCSRRWKQFSTYLLYRASRTPPPPTPPPPPQTTTAAKLCKATTAAHLSN